MNLKIIKAQIKGEYGIKILKPNNMVIRKLELEDYRRGLKESELDTVLFTYEEIG